MENNSISTNNVTNDIIYADENMKPVISFVDGESPDETKYLILLYIYITDDDSFDHMMSWEVITGRQNAYDRLRVLTENENIDPDKSFILVEPHGKYVGSNMKTAATVYRFLRTMKDKDKVIDNTGFDPDDYRNGIEENEVADPLLTDFKEDYEANANSEVV